MLQTHYQVLRPATTAHLAQTMTLLSLTADELQQQIEAELAANPALEMVEERRCPGCHRLLPERGSCPVCSQPPNAVLDEPVVFVSPREDFTPSRDVYGEEMSDEPLSPVMEDLPTYVLRQIASELENEDRRIAAFLLTHLDDNGLLTTTPLEVALYFHVPLSRVERVQHIIQHADPIGVGSCTPQQALLVQLEVVGESHPHYELARMMILEGMDLLSRHQYSQLARVCDANLRDVQETARYISENLTPFPARMHWGDARQPEPRVAEVYRRPDILINYLNEDPKNPLVVEIILPVCGTLRVNPLYRQAFRQSEEGTKEEMKPDLERASLFVKCLQQRNNTMQRLMQKVTKIQRGYITRGEKHLHAITRAELSRELEVHESTISRAVANKAVQLPNGRIVPLSSFFDRNLKERTVLRELIERETRPLSDSELVVQLENEGFKVARRTVAKYRAMEGILPAHLRHKGKNG